MKSKCLLILIYFICSTLGVSQDSTQIILLGNTANLDQSNSLLLLLNAGVIDKKDKILLGLGDYTDKNGINKNISSANKWRLNWLKEQATSVREAYLLSGDRDWDNSGRNGWKKSKELDNYLKKELSLKKGLVLGNGCPGPKVEKLNASTALIMFNSQWLIHPHEKPGATDDACDLFDADDFWAELEDIIDDNVGKRIILAAHHPIHGHGYYSGENLAAERIYIPIIGSFIADYRKNVGSPSDFSYPHYQAYRERLSGILANYSNIIFISGHEYNTEIVDEDDNILINSGNMVTHKSSKKTNEQLFLANEPVLTCLTIYSNKDVKIYLRGKNTSKQIAINWERTKVKNLSAKVPSSAPKSFIAGKEYAAGGFKQFFMGDGYRKEWTTPIEVPSLILDQIYGGMRPYAKGGGLQTSSLKFKAKNGNKYAFRSINKNPEKSLDAQLSQTIYKHIVKDLITTQHPYGGLVAANLLDHTNILHVNPILYSLPPQDALGEYNQEFAGSLGTLELRPDSNKKSTFGDAHDIFSTHQMYRGLINQEKHSIDKQAYARARVFDMWMGDWDRHQDNWKWAAYKKKKQIVYRPIPRDRDHVFSKWSGVIPSIADYIIPNAENFGESFGNILQLNWKARHLDRFLGNELTKSDWIEAAQYLQAVIDKEKITQAINTLPPEIKPFSGDEIEKKLISRLSELPEAASKNYSLLAKEVDIVGSNKKDNYYITSESNGNLIIEIKDKDQDFYKRKFIPEETKTVNLYGLGKKDDFLFNMEYPSPIKIRIIGGKGEDEIIDNFPSVDKNVSVYDKNETDKLPENAKIKRKKDYKDPVYNVNEFDYPSLLPFAGISSSSGNGTGIEISLAHKKKAFNRPGYAREMGIRAVYYPTWAAHNIELSQRNNYFIGTKHLVSKVNISNYYSKFPFYYGIGNNTSRDDELYEDSFYRIDYNTAKMSLGLENTFLRKSNLHYYLDYQYNNVEIEDDVPTQLASEENVFGLGKIHNIGIGIALKLDMRDNSFFTRHGSYLESRWVTYYSNLSTFSKFNLHLAKYITYNLIGPTTFILAGGMSHTMGDAPFYMQSTLGSNSYLRGHVRNRFVDRSALYYNSELRIHLGTWRTILAPIRFGVFGFHDSGKVFDGDLNFYGHFNSTFGGGFYLAPLSDDYSLTFTLSDSDDKENYFRFAFGWNL